MREKLLHILNSSNGNRVETVRDYSASVMGQQPLNFLNAFLNTVVFPVNSDDRVAAHEVREVRAHERNLVGHNADAVTVRARELEQLGQRLRRRSGRCGRRVRGYGLSKGSALGGDIGLKRL